MNGQKYEIKVANYLKSHGYHNVKVTKTSGDYGVDITATKHFHKYAVQCKYYSKPVGISAVQQVVAGMAYYECDRALVITNSTFTRQATQLAEHNNVELLSKIKGSYSNITILLLRICALAALYILYLMGYWKIVLGILIIAVSLFILGLYLKLSIYKTNHNDEIEEADSK